MESKLLIKFDKSPDLKIWAITCMLQSFHPTHAQLSNRNGKFVFSGAFHIIWVEVGQGILLNRSIFLNKSNQLCINIT